MPNKFRLAFLFFLISLKGFTQKKLETTALNRIIFTKNDTLYQFFVFKPEKKFVAASGKKYHWYRPDTILITNSGFDNKLLDGEYKVFYPNKNIKESGTFDKGLKTAEWKAWDVNGQLVQIYNWKNGYLEGKFLIYDGNGNIYKEGKYKKDIMFVKKKKKKKKNK